MFTKNNVLAAACARSVQSTSTRDRSNLTSLTRSAYDKVCSYSYSYEIVVRITLTSYVRIGGTSAVQYVRTYSYRKEVLRMALHMSFEF